MFNRLLKEDSSRKILAYHESDEEEFPKLNKFDQLPTSIDTLVKYIAEPRYNERTKKLLFYARFRTRKTLNEIKRTSDILEWLNVSGVWIKTTQLTTTTNVRCGFFIGKSPRITNLEAMTTLVKTMLSSKFNKVADFQLIHDNIGNFKEKSTRSKALVLECAKDNFRSLSLQLQEIFQWNPRFPLCRFTFWARWIKNPKTSITKS